MRVSLAVQEEPRKNMRWVAEEHEDQMTQEVQEQDGQDFWGDEAFSGAPVPFDKSSEQGLLSQERCSLFQRGAKGRGEIWSVGGSNIIHEACNNVGLHRNSFSAELTTRLTCSSSLFFLLFPAQIDRL